MTSGTFKLEIEPASESVSVDLLLLRCQIPGPSICGFIPKVAITRMYLLIVGPRVEIIRRERWSLEFPGNLNVDCNLNFLEYIF